MKRDQKKFNIKLDRVLQTGSVTNISAVQLELEGAEKWIAELQRAIQHQEDCLGLTGLTKLREREISLFLCGYRYTLWDQDTTWPAAC